MKSSSRCRRCASLVAAALGVCLVSIGSAPMLLPAATSGPSAPGASTAKSSSGSGSSSAAPAQRDAATIAAASNFSTEGFTFDIAPGPFRPQRDAFGALYRCPDWFRDAKFGIYMHWGLGTVPGFDGHYARYMYTQREPEAYRVDQQTKRKALSGYKPGREKVYEYHVAKFGHPSKFGYKDFIPLWKAERFDAAELAAFYRDCGARFVGVMAVHHDNFDLYDSTHQPWNSYRMGPRIDVVGAWQKACRTSGLRFFITSHLSNEGHEHLFYQGEADVDGPLKGVPYDTMDPRNDGLYGKRTPDRLRRINPDFARSWYLRTKELVDKYEPDLLYLDGGLPNGDYGLNLAAHFYNRSVQRHGRVENIFAIKRTSPKGFTLDIEAAGADRLMEQPFLVDTTINPGWFYLGASISAGEGGNGDEGMGGVAQSTKGADKVRLNAGQVIDNLVDIVSKNGNMMLNVGLRADGSLPDTFRRELLDVGQWLKTNGEAIYGTRPFSVFGEGPFQKPKSENKFDDNLYRYTARDIRFTTKPGAVYATLLDWPGDGADVAIRTLTAERLPKVREVTLLATGETLRWKQTADGLHVTMPAKAPGAHAYVLKIARE